MSAKLAVFYHSRISGGAHPPSRHGPATHPINREHAVSVVAEQMNALHSSGLASEASEFVIGLNGDMEDYRTVKRLVGNAEIALHGPEAAGELPTLAVLEKWVRTHLDYYVLYFHGKGVCWPDMSPGTNGYLRMVWRRCLMKVCVANWQECVGALDSGCEMAGGHWLTAEKYPISAAALPHPIWGGNFWWATGAYLKQLPPVQKDRSWDSKYDSEMWPVSGRPSKVRDFADHWPGEVPCGRNAT